MRKSTCTLLTVAMISGGFGGVPAAADVYYDPDAMYSGTPRGKTACCERGFALEGILCTTVSGGINTYSDWAYAGY